MLSVSPICFEDRFCTSKKGVIGRGGWAYSRRAVHMVAALAGCRTALVGTGWIISHLVSTNGDRNHSSPLVGAPVDSFQSGGAFAGRRTLTIESLLMSGCG